jgi:hypothetical protein
MSRQQALQKIRTADRVSGKAQRRSEGQFESPASRYLAEKAREASQWKDDPGDELSSLRVGNGT